MNAWHHIIEKKRKEKTRKEKKTNKQSSIQVILLYFDCRHRYLYIQKLLSFLGVRKTSVAFQFIDWMVQAPSHNHINLWVTDFWFIRFYTSLSPQWHPKLAQRLLTLVTTVHPNNTRENTDNSSRMVQTLFQNSWQPCHSVVKHSSQHHCLYADNYLLCDKTISKLSEFLTLSARAGTMWTQE